MNPLPEGAFIGIIGGGQLGMMLAEAAHRLGYRVLGYSDAADCPLAREADELVVGAYDDEARLAGFARRAGVVTVETETLPARTLEVAAETADLLPGAGVVLMTQDRAKQRTFTAGAGVAVPVHRVVTNAGEAAAAARELTLPVVFKRATGGYDGRGQAWVERAEDAEAAWLSLGGGVCVVEERVPFAAEFSVIVCRDRGGNLAFFDPIRNVHRGGILRVSRAPAGIPAESAKVAREFAYRFAVATGLAGIACLECYLLPDGGVLVNEVAARPHNSGHLTIEACAASQFEQLVRIAAGLPLGETTLLQPATMLNLIGDIDEAALAGLEAAYPGRCFVHLYGKAPRPGRKLGHVTVVGTAEAEPPACRAGCEIG
ncbi:5-(carboxyamino)imidazole ribonucleotide synthase [Tepidiforma sp.]|uniref:5-(carboxyamino)imidazole ribonucleotide synthase n=1 Tax=Tepidiforma sp. TaxID=2682230 RepID=UPI002ADE421F|nr:5-(carboxyamino)imidazole ribonucleotide synthase [Tepidiforma sp.]